MKLKMIEKTKEELLDELEHSLNEYDECEMDVLNEIIGHKSYVRDRDNVYINTKDGLLVIPYDDVIDNDCFVVYEVLLLKIAYLAKEEVEKIQALIKEKEDFVSMLKSFI